MSKHSGRAPEAKAFRAGFGPHCQVLRTGHPGAPAFLAVWRGKAALRTFPTIARARAWLAACDATGQRQPS